MSTERVIRDYFDAVNGEKWDLLAELFHEDGSYQTMGARPRSGRDDVLNFFGKAFTAWTVHHDAPTNLIVDSESAAVEVTFTGTALDGRSLTFEAIDIFKLRDGKIASVSTWYDLIAVRKMLAGDAHDR